jgi:IS5 family transposase
VRSIGSPPRSPGSPSQSLRQVQAVARNARGVLARRPGDGRLGRLVGQLEETIAATGRLLWQTAQRLGGNRVIGRSAGVAFGPGRPPDPQGQAQTSHRVRLQAAAGRRRAWGHRRPQLEQGNPPDAAQLVPAVQRVAAITGHAPGTVVGDRGFGTAANDRALAELGVVRIGLQRNGTPGRARLALERTRAFGRMRNWRVGIEARISHLKRGFGSRRTRLRRLPGARTWVGLGSSPITCSA